MSNEKLTALESSAIKKKRREFEAEISRALQPIFERYLGMMNSGNYANHQAADAGKKHSAGLEHAAKSELIDRIEYLHLLISQSDNFPVVE